MRKPPILPSARPRRALRWVLLGSLAFIVVLRFGVLRNFYAEAAREKAEEARARREVRMARSAPREWVPGQGWPGPPQGQERPGQGQPGGRPGGRRSSLPTRAAAYNVPPDFARLNITIAESDADILRGYHWSGWNGGQGAARPKVPAMVSDGQTTYSNVMVHSKGSAGSFRRFDDKPSLTLDFSKASPSHEFRGMKKLSLNNSAQDPSFLSEIISRELFQAAGVPVPKATHATAVVNGRDLGLFVMVEGWGKHFLHRHFMDVGGNLYDGGFCKDIDSAPEVNSGDDQNDRSDLEALASAAESDARGRMGRLNRVLDVDSFYKMAAMEALTCHWDGYSMNRNNYRVFHDRATGRMVFMPHGMDQMFGVMRSSPTASIVPHWNGLVARGLLSLPESRERYLHEVAALRTNVLDPDKLAAHIADLAAKLEPTLAAYSPDFVAQQQSAARRLSERIVARAHSVDRQLAKRLGTAEGTPNGE